MLKWRVENLEWRAHLTLSSHRPSGLLECLEARFESCSIRSNRLPFQLWELRLKELRDFGTITRTKGLTQREDTRGVFTASGLGGFDLPSSLPCPQEQCYAMVHGSSAWASPGGLLEIQSQAPPHAAKSGSLGEGDTGFCFSASSLGDPQAPRHPQPAPAVPFVLVLTPWFPSSKGDNV